MSMIGSRTRLRDLVPHNHNYVGKPSSMTLGDLLQRYAMQQHPNSYVAGTPLGLLAQGNLDLNRRPKVRNPDGSISTVRSITVGFDDGTYVLPTVIGNRVVSEDEAIEHFRRTGQHLGRFRSQREAEGYAQNLHLAQERQYVRRK